MEKVFLRVYNREIEGMIEGGQLDEATAHCQHILKLFPMHIDTYRLFGKALLEARRYSDAADIFQRVLMAVPDDFVSQVGMSIIKDDQGKLDDAIWHMERAFEVQPSNSAIQGELRRLYGRRDGVEPSKIRLTRDALANMYAQGELFNQAIAEIRSVLADDPNRPDLQVMLARAYYRSGQKVESAEMAATLLKRYPYCMDGLRILVEVLPGTARAENTQVYRERLQQLDPYSSSVVDSIFASDQVADAAVKLERLDYRPGTAMGSSHQDWASSLGVMMGEKKRDGVPVDRMKNSGTSGTEAPLQNHMGSEHVSSPEPPADAIPEWMRTAGWQDSTDETKDESVESGETQPQDTIAKAEIPDWLMSMAPAGAVEEPEPEDEDLEESLSVGPDGIPDWLKPATAETGVDEAKTAHQVAAGPSLMETEEKPEPPETAVLPISTTEAIIEPLTVPDSQPASDEGVPDWLTHMNAAEPSSLAEEGGVAFEPQAVTSEGIPDWLKPINPPETGGTAPEQEKGIEPKSGNDEDIPDWLKPGMPSSSFANPSEDNEKIIEPLFDADEEIPEWLKPVISTESDGISTMDHPVSIAPQPAENDGIPEWLNTLDSPKASEEQIEDLPGFLAPQAAENEALPDWITGLAPMQEAEKPSGESLDENETPIGFEEKVPGPLLHEAATDASTIVQPSMVESQPVETGTFPPVSGTEAEPGTTMEQEPETINPAFPDWLAGIGSRASAAAVSATEIVEEPMYPDDAVPEKIIPNEVLQQEPVEPPIAEPKIIEESIQPQGEMKPLSIEDDALGWLESLAAKQGAKPEELLTKPQDRSAEMPEWLREPVLGEKESSGEAVPEEIETPLETRPLEALNDQLYGTSPSLSDRPFEAAIPVWEEEPAYEQPEEMVKSAETQFTSIDEAQIESPVNVPVDHPMPSEAPLSELSDERENLFDGKQEGAEGEHEFPPEGDVLPAFSESESTEDISITSWLSKLDVDEALGKTPAESPKEERVTSAAEELPDWLKDLESPADHMEKTHEGDDLPEWLRHPISSEELGKPIEEETPAWVDENAPVTGEAIPTAPDEWVPADMKVDANQRIGSVLEIEPVESTLQPSASEFVEVPERIQEFTPTTKSEPIEKSAPLIQPVAYSVQSFVHQPTLKQTGMLSPIPVKDKDAELLSNAQTILDQDSLDESMKQYSKLIRKGRLLDEIIHDLREAIYRYPVDVIIWQTLGDAYMRANRLQDALDAYTKAEELLR
jgi:tetratricopeptide (TPR) repeat protein